MYADCLSKLYRSAVVREKTEGAAKKLRDKYTELGKALISERNCRGLREMTGHAAKEFSTIIRTDANPNNIQRVEKRIKELYPHLSLLFLDFDSNTSEVNIYNRCRIFPTFV